MTKWLFATLLLVAGLDAAACPLCMGTYQSSAGQQLIDLQRAVLAIPAPKYVALLKSDVRQQCASRLAIVMYLRQSPGGSALGVDLPPSTSSP